MRAKLTNAHGLGSLRCEELSKSNGERSRIYEYKNGKFNKLNPLSLSWKYAGGGMESNAYDLLRFGMKLLDGKIISKTRVTEMTSKPDNLSNYAYGWDTGTDKGQKVFAKGGAQPGARSYIRCYPDEDIVIVLVANTRGSGITQLGRDIGKIVSNDQ